MAQPSICPGKWGKLLVCTDGSVNSKGAVTETLSLAHRCGSTVYALQVLEVVPTFEAVAPELTPRLQEELAVQMEDIQNTAAEMGVSLEPRSLRNPSPHAAILEEADDIQPDLIIMGRHGRTGLARLLMGSVTSRVIGYSPFNVLVVPPGATLGFDHILVGSDGSLYSEAAWHEALTLVKHGAGKLFAVSAAREEGDLIRAREIIHRLLTQANKEGIPFRGLVPQGQEPDDAIVQAAIKHEVDLIILGSHGRTGLKRLLMGSTAERVIGRAPCPVLVVKQMK